LIDTVGIRRKTRVSSAVEREGVKRSIDNIRKSDVALFILESTVTPSKQEKRLIDICVEAGVSIAIIVNKWDLVKEKQSKTVLAYEDLFRGYFPFLSWAPIVFLSALTGQRIHTILDVVLRLHGERTKRITEQELRDFLYKARAKQKPQWLRGQKKPYIYELRQTGSAPPRFELIVQDRFSIPTAYLRYLENRLREQFGFDGVPIVVYTTQRKEYTTKESRQRKR
jgi:GTP-binding protein